MLPDTNHYRLTNRPVSAGGWHSSPRVYGHSRIGLRLAPKQVFMLGKLIQKSGAHKLSTLTPQHASASLISAPLVSAFVHDIVN
jgi:hypothetical protein